MRSASATLFYKQKTCPGTEKLWRYAEAKLMPADEAEVGEHLAACEFCGAEAQLLTRHPPLFAAQCPAPGQIPAHVRRLIEDLMAIKTAATAERLVEILYEKEGLTLTDA